MGVKESMHQQQNSCMQQQHQQEVPLQDVQSTARPAAIALWRARGLSKPKQSHASASEKSRRLCMMRRNGAKLS
jgi:hypothetical protein